MVSATSGADGIQLNPGSSGSTIQGLIINNFDDDGIDIAPTSSNNIIVGNWIGLDNTGTVVQANATGIEMTSGGNTIGGNDSARAKCNIRKTPGFGIYIGSATAVNNTIQGNYIGTNATGTSDIGNNVGINLVGGANNNTIGGIVVGAGNVISGNDSDGLTIQGSGTSNNIVQGNIIGLDATGTVGLGKR